MNKITIVTDSTSDLPRNIYKDYGLIGVPLSVVFKDKIYIDNGIDIKPDNFYKMIEDSSEMPQASQPTSGNFIKVYNSLINQGKEIIAFIEDYKVVKKILDYLGVDEFKRDRLHLRDYQLQIYSLQMLTFPIFLDI